MAAEGEQLEGLCPCDLVRPENAARAFSSPSAILLKSERLGLLERTDRSVLEVGSGNLRNPNYLHTLGFHDLHVYELPATIARWPHKYDEFGEVGGTVHDSHFPAHQYDLVLCSFVIETICPEHRRQDLVDNIAKSMRQDAILLLEVRGPADVITASADGKGIICPSGEGYLTPSKTFIRPFTIPDLVSVLENGGLEIWKTFHKPQTIAPRLIRLIARRRKV